MNETRRMLTAEEVAERLGVSRTTAYTVIRGLNAKLEEMGRKTIAKRVSNEYFEEAFFGPFEKEVAAHVR